MDALTEAPPRIDPRRYHESASRGAQRARPRPKPVCLYLETTNRCNLLCTTCPRTYAELEPPADMSWELFTRIVDQVPEHRARRAARRRRADAGEEPAADGPLPEGPRRLRAVQHQRHGAQRQERPRADRRRARRTARLARCRQRASPIAPVRGKDYFNRILRNVRAFRDLQEREGQDRPRVSAWLTGPQGDHRASCRPS